MQGDQAGVDHHDLVDNRLLHVVGHAHPGRHEGELRLGHVHREGQVQDDVVAVLDGDGRDGPVVGQRHGRHRQVHYLLVALGHDGDGAGERLVARGADAVVVFADGNIGHVGYAQAVGAGVVDVLVAGGLAVAVDGREDLATDQRYLCVRNVLAGVVIEHERDRAAIGRTDLDGQDHLGLVRAIGDDDLVGVQPRRHVGRRLDEDGEGRAGARGKRGCFQARQAHPRQDARRQQLDGAHRAQPGVPQGYCAGQHRAGV